MGLMAAEPSHPRTDRILAYLKMYTDLSNNYLQGMIVLKNKWKETAKLCTITGAISTEHSPSELMVIGTDAHRVDSYFLHLTMHF